MRKEWYYLGVGVMLLGLFFRQPLLLIIGLLAVLVLLTAQVWARYCLSNLHVTRNLSEKRVLFGEEITLTLTIENAKVLPLPWLEIEDVVPNAFNVQGRQLRVNASTNRTVLESLFSPRWYERVTRNYTISCHQRGVHTFGPTRLRSSDLFGFTERAEQINNQQYLIVYPLIVPLSSFNLPSRHPFGDRKALRKLLEDPSRVNGVRDYVYGDDLRRIHWKATARAMTMQSKIYEATTTHTLVIFLNVETRLDSYFSLYPELQELAICAAASVSDWALSAGYAVGLYANSIMYLPEMGMQLPARKPTETEEESLIAQKIIQQFRQQRVQIPPASHQEQRKRIMEVLARLQTYLGISITALIQQERSNLPSGSTIVMITTTVNDPLLDTLTQLRQAGHTVSILLVGKQSMSHQLANIPIYHLGGEETWERLKAASIDPQGAAPGTGALSL